MVNKKTYQIFLSLIMTFTATGFLGKFLSSSFKQEKATSEQFFNVIPVPASYLYSPGLMGSELVMGRYCPQFIASTGEKVSWKVGGHVIGQRHSAVKFSEINLKKPTGFTLNPFTALSYGIRQDLFPLIAHYFREKYGIMVEDNPQSSETVANYSFKLHWGNVGQRRDIKILQNSYLQHIKKYPHTAVILYGDSRGAATTFNFIALHNPPEVKAAVLEGIFDDIPHLLKHFLYNNKDLRTEQRLHNILSFCMGSYRKNGPFPRNYAEKISDDIPLLFVTSLQDWIVPPQCTLYLYNRLKERGHKKIHLLVLQTASHPGYMLDDEKDQTLYENVVHAFYKTYGLPHNQRKALAGQKALERTQPSVAEVKQRYALQACETCL